MIDSEIVNYILAFGPAFLLIAVRAFAMIQVSPLLSSDAIHPAVKFALAGLTAFIVIPTAEVFMPGQESLENSLFAGLLPGGSLSSLRYETFSLRFGLLVVGEALIGIIIGFYITIIFAAFSTAGQFFSLQMGFGASETFDPVAQVENPLMGQYFNMVAMLVFVTIGGFHRLFLGGFWRSVQTINIVSLIEGREHLVMMLVSGLSRLFMDAIIIATPILGTLFLTSLTTGLISKASPQINILSEGFPISIITAFLLIFASLPFMIEAFINIMESGFNSIELLYAQIGRPVTGGN